MTSPSPDDRDNLKALELLSAAAAQPAKPATQTPPAAAPPAPRTPDRAVANLQASSPTGPPAARTAAPPPPPMTQAPRPTAPPPVTPQRGAPVSPSVPVANAPPRTPAAAAPSAAPPAPPRPASTPPPATPRSAPPAPAVPVPRCLKCGYRLLPDGGLRCSECGRQHKPAQIEAYYSGIEQRRIEQIIWLASVGLFLRLLTPAALLGLESLPLLQLAQLGIAILTGWACGVAGWRRFDTECGRYAIAGMIVCGATILFSLREFLRGAQLATGDSTSTIIALDLLAAWLLLAAMSRPNAGADVWGATLGRRIAFVGLIATPILAVGHAIVSNVLTRSGAALGALNLVLSSGGTGIPTRRTFGLLWEIVLVELVPHLLLIAVWIFVWRWYTAYHRALFVGRER